MYRGREGGRGRDRQTNRQKETDRQKIYEKERNIGRTNKAQKGRLKE